MISLKKKAVLSDRELIDWLRLLRSENVGVKTFFNLIEFYGDSSRALEAIPHLARNGGRKKPIKLASTADVEKELEKTSSFGAAVITFFDPRYPEFLKEIYDPPPAITVSGNIDYLKRPQIAIVGARNASINGCNFAGRLSYDLGQKDYIITSGLAHGIDTAAHQSSLKTGTIAVIAGGIDSIYPKENEKLYAAIKEQGAIVSELPFGAAPKPENFPQRNRIISGLSEGVVIVEAALKSGSLITARMALEQNREVFAVPGHPADPRCQGPNKLIKEGAHLIESAKDILDNLHKPLNPNLFAEKNQPSFLNPPFKIPAEDLIAGNRAAVAAALSQAPTAIDDLVRNLELPVNIIHTIILELELAGRLSRHPGNKVSLIG